MGVRRSCLFLAGLLMPAVADASDHKVDGFGALSYLNGSSSSLGLHISVAPTLGEKLRWLSIAFDASGHFVKLDGDLKQLTVLAGPRLTLPGAERHRIPYVHVLGGVADSNHGSSVGVLAIGAGIDIAPGDEKKLGFRAQVDRIIPVSSDQDSTWRVSAGVVFRVPH